MVVFQLHPSQRYFKLLVGLTFSTIALIIALYLSIWTKFILVGAAGLLVRHAWLKQYHVCSFTYRNDHSWYLETEEGVEAINFAGDSVLTAYFMVLRIKGVWRSYVVLLDSFKNPSDYRHFLSLLKIRKPIKTL